MGNKKDKTQLMVWVSLKLNKRIKKIAKDEGLTKASWLRSLIIKTVDSIENS